MKPVNWHKALELDSPSVPEDPTVIEGDFNASEVEEMAKNSLDFLAALCMPLVFKYLFPVIFKSIWGLLTSYAHKIRDFSQLAIGLPRGFGKTMLIKLFVIYCILFTKKRFILIICGTQTKANNIITDIISALNELNIKSVFGDWKLGAETDRQDLKRFGFRGRTIILMGAGAQSDIRGVTLENERPDVMIFDDIQTREDADSETVSRNLETWMLGTAMKAKSPHGCLYIFLGNMYPTKHSLLKKIKKDPTWIKYITGGILADGTSLWEDLQPVSQLLKEFQRDFSAGRPEIFRAEVLNDEEAIANNCIDITKIPPYSIPEDEIHQGNFIIIDPANDKVNSDAVSIMYFEVHDGFPVCKELKEGRLSPGDTIVEALKMALTHNCRVIGVESNAYQYSLLYWFQFICAQRGILGIEAVELYSGNYSKNSRILTMFKQLLSGEVKVSPECKAAVELQILAFNSLKRDNTDGLLDCLTYAPKMLELYPDLIIGGTVVEEQSFGNLRVWSEIENASF